MRFNRAAKVAAFPLLALVLVVALVACQGPVGKAGAAGEKGDTGAGTPGTNADPAFQAMAVPVVIFNTQAGEPEDEVGEEKDPMDLNDFVANASGDVSFEIIDTSGWIAPANYDLDGSMLTLSVPDGFEPAVADHDEDAVDPDRGHGRWRQRGAACPGERKHPTRARYHRPNHPRRRHAARSGWRRR